MVATRSFKVGNVKENVFFYIFTHKNITSVKMAFLCKNDTIVFQSFSQTYCENVICIHMYRPMSSASLEVPFMRRSIQQQQQHAPARTA